MNLREYRETNRPSTSPRSHSRHLEEDFLANCWNPKGRCRRRNPGFLMVFVALLFIVFDLLLSMHHQTSFLLATVRIGPSWESTDSFTTVARNKTKDVVLHTNTGTAALPPASTLSLIPDVDGEKLRDRYYHGGNSTRATKRTALHSQNDKRISPVDATSLRRYRARIHQSQKAILYDLHQSTSKQKESGAFDTSTLLIETVNRHVYWNIVEEVMMLPASSSTPFSQAIPSPSSFVRDAVCGVGPGQGIEEDAGYKLLVEKIRLASRRSDSRSDLNTKLTDGIAKNADLGKTRSSPPARLFCGIYSYSARRSQVQVQAWSWGWKCDGFVAFSNESLPDFGIYPISFDGEEAYGNLWQKIRAIWTHIYENFGDQYDYFHLGGDDMYLLVENMRDFLEARDQHVPLSGKIGTKANSSIAKNETNIFDKFFMGQWLPAKEMIAGGPGYTLNAAALEALVLHGLPNCSSNLTAPYEDRLISKCFAQYLGILGNQTDTREESTGEQRYHDAAPSMLYSFRSANHNRNGQRGSYQSRMAASWEEQTHPTLPNHPPVGPKHGLDAAASTSVSFHNIHNPYYVARVHSILFPQMCPTDSPLFRGLSLHSPSWLRN